MPCIELPAITAPDLSLLLPDLGITTPDPHVGVSLCCELSSPPIPTVTVSVGTIPGIATILAGANSLISETVDELNGLLDSIQVTCPLQ